MSKIEIIYDYRKVNILRDIHGILLVKYKDKEIYQAYLKYRQSSIYYSGITSRNFLYFIW